MNMPDFSARITYTGHTQIDAVLLLEGHIIGGVSMARDDDDWWTVMYSDLDGWADSAVQSFLDECEADEDCFYTRQDLMAQFEVAVNTAACSA